MDQRIFPGLNGNQLKLIALVSMTLDHIGLQLLPQMPFLRVLGRLAFPLFAYMIAEGCQYTRSRRRYLLSMAALAFVCQMVYFFAMGSLYMCVLVTFSLSICLIYAMDFGRSRGGAAWLVSIAALAIAVYVCELLPRQLAGFGVDYGIWGVLLPVFAYLGTGKQDKFALTAAGLILLSRSLGGIQWFCLFSLLPLHCYDGTRGRRKMKYLFYIYYPLHLVVIYGLSLLIR